VYDGICERLSDFLILETTPEMTFLSGQNENACYQSFIIHTTIVSTNKMETTLQAKMETTI
jgi:hypothetical protein